MGDDTQQRPVRVCLTRCPLPPPDENIHSLPCHIRHDGAAAIKSYFRPEPIEGENKTYLAEFRGVQLHGKHVSLPDMGMQGLVLEDAGMTHPNDEGRIWEIDNHFEEMTFWQVPNSGDDETNLLATLAEWNALARALESRLVTPATGSWRERAGTSAVSRPHVASPRLHPQHSRDRYPAGSSASPPQFPLALLATMPTRPTTTSPAIGVTSSTPAEVDAVASSSSQAPSSSFSIIARGEEVATTSTGTTTPQRHGTKRPRGSESSMCRRGSGDAGDVVTLAPMRHAQTKISTTSSEVLTVNTVTRSFAFAAAAASAHVTSPPPLGYGNNLTICARVQRLLVQFVMLPVVWVSLCCILTAAMGIEAMESIHNAFVIQDEDTVEPPTKKLKRDTSDQLSRPELAEQRKTSPTTVDDTPVSIPQSPLVRRRRRVLIWDLDETLVLFASLYSGQFARTHDKDLATSVVLGEQMMTYLLAVLERHFFFSALHNTDLDHIGQATTSDAAICERYERIRAIYERRSDGPVDFLDEPASQWFTAREALVTSIDTLSTGWLRTAQELLALTQSSNAAGGDDEIINVMVTNTQFTPALCKCLIYGLDAYFPIESVYSSSKLHKLRCFQTIMAKYATPSSDDVDVEFLAIGDGPEEEQVSQALGLPFFKIRSLDDLRQLQYELQLVETPTGESDTNAKGKTMPTPASPVGSPSTAQCP